jgi:ribosomal protein S18 acetylase RimI-like enzyme
MTVRRADEADLSAIDELWLAFETEVPAPAHVTVDHEHERQEIREIVSSGLGFVGQHEDEIVGFALARTTGPALGRITDLYVAPTHRRRGLAAALASAAVAALRERGAEHVDLEVMAANTEARAIYHRWGFREDVVTMVASTAELEERLQPDQHARSFASIHVQTDDRPSVERAVEQFAPRIGSKGSRVEGPRNGWTAVYDEAIDRDRAIMLRFARELSSRMGIVVVAFSLELDQVVRLVALDRGGIVDEYLSVPEFYGPLPPGDVIGLSANPTVLERLTGADPAAVRAAAPTGSSPADLPPARELLSGLAAAVRIEGAQYGYGEE